MDDEATKAALALGVSLTPKLSEAGQGTRDRLLETIAAREAAAFRRGAEAMREAVIWYFEAKRSDAIWHSLGATTHDEDSADTHQGIAGDYAQNILALRALPLPEEPAMRWQPIETAPRDEGWVLVGGFWEGERARWFVRWNMGQWEDERGEPLDWTPLYWLPIEPLPAPPDTQ